MRAGHKTKTQGSHERMGPLSVLLVALLGTLHLGSPARPRGDARAQRFRGLRTAAPGHTFERATPPAIQRSKVRFARSFPELYF